MVNPRIYDMQSRCLLTKDKSRIIIQKCRNFCKQLTLPGRRAQQLRFSKLSGYARGIRWIPNLHTHFKYVKNLSNKKFLDIRELYENVLGTSNAKIGHFLASLFADAVPFPYDIPWPV